MQDQIICPHCKKPFSLPEVFAHDIQEKALDKVRKENIQEMEELKRKLEASEKIELQLRKEKNTLDEEKRKFELEKQRQIDSEREKIRQKTLEESAESYRLKMKEYEKKLEDMAKAVDEAQRKGLQGSQQLQGEVQELDFEELLRREFPNDTVEPIGKGVLGADIRHIVRSPLGRDCGHILWESKRTKTWSDGWITKLKEDYRNDKADIPALISEALPDEVKNGLGNKDGVWVASPKLALVLASLLRKPLLDTAKERVRNQDMKNKAEFLYTYVTSHEFTQQVEAMMEAYNQMLTQISKERVAYEKMWKQREIQVNRLLNGVSGIYGSMQEIAGPALPTIKSFELPLGEQED